MSNAFYIYIQFEVLVIILYIGINTAVVTCFTNHDLLNHLSTRLICNSYCIELSSSEIILLLPHGRGFPGGVSGREPAC